MPNNVHPLELLLQYFRYRFEIFVCLVLLMTSFGSVLVLFFLWLFCVVFSTMSIVQCNWLPKRLVSKLPQYIFARILTLLVLNLLQWRLYYIEIQAGPKAASIQCHTVCSTASRIKFMLNAWLCLRYRFFLLLLLFLYIFINTLECITPEG